MHFEFLLEEPSAVPVVEAVVPRIVGAGHTFSTRPFTDKGSLLADLETTFRGYQPWLPDDWRIVVLVDEDREDCKALRRTIAGAARRAGLTPKGRNARQWQVLPRVVVEELEAWFFGDVAALRAAYPKVPATLGSRAAFRDADGVKGGTWEQLERVLQAAGYFANGLAKRECARAIAPHLDPTRNSSRSFQAFREGLLSAFPLA